MKIHSTFVVVPKKIAEQNVALEDLQIWVEDEFVDNFTELMLDVEYIGELYLEHGGEPTFDELFPEASDVAFFRDTSCRLSGLFAKY